MAGSLQIFGNPGFGQVGKAAVDGELWSVGKEEFLKKAKEMGYTQKLIDEIVREMEENIAHDLPVDWEMCLVELPISD